jgi:hypothetical protein
VTERERLDSMRSKLGLGERKKAGGRRRKGQRLQETQALRVEALRQGMPQEQVDRELPLPDQEEQSSLPQQPPEEPPQQPLLLEPSPPTSPGPSEPSEESEPMSEEQDEPEDEEDDTDEMPSGLPSDPSERQRFLDSVMQQMTPEDQAYIVSRMVAGAPQKPRPKPQAPPPGPPEMPGFRQASAMPEPPHQEDPKQAPRAPLEERVEKLESLLTTMIRAIDKLPKYIEHQLVQRFTGQAGAEAQAAPDQEVETVSGPAGDTTMVVPNRAAAVLQQAAPGGGGGGGMLQKFLENRDFLLQIAQGLGLKKSAPQPAAPLDFDKMTMGDFVQFMARAREFQNVFSGDLLQSANLLQKTVGTGMVKQVAQSAAAEMTGQLMQNIAPQLQAFIRQEMAAGASQNQSQGDYAGKAGLVGMPGRQG